MSEIPVLASERAGAVAKQQSIHGQAGHVLERAVWASRAYARFDADSVARVVRAVAAAAAEKAEEYAAWAVRETGFGVVEHKVIKNLACSTGLLDRYAGHDFVSHRVDESMKIVEVPRPAGVVLALTPSTNPVASVYFKALLALMTRNAVVISPHPMAKEVCSAAAQHLAEAAVAAGAPDGVVQWLPEPSIPLVEAVMQDERTDLIVATGGTGVVRAAYSSSNPALGVGPANVPVLVDRTADVRRAAQEIVDSKAFDNSVLCTNESVLVVEDAVADSLLAEMQRQGAHVLTQEETGRLAAHMFPMGTLNTEVIGKDATVIAEAAGIRTGPRTRVLVAPMSAALPEEPMAREKLSPVLGVLRVPDVTAGIAAARALLRHSGAGHSAAIHSEDADTVMAYSSAVPVLRVAVNVGNSTGSAGLSTNLAPSMTIGTGFLGRSSIGENLEPRHLLNWSRIAYHSDPSVAMPDFARQDPTVRPTAAIPRYPSASNDRTGTAPTPAAAGRGGSSGALDTTQEAQLREQIRRLVTEELSHLMKG